MATNRGCRDGFLVSIHAETRYGEDINPDTGMLTFANFNMAFPKAGENATGVTKFIVSQSLSDEFVVFAGKINTLDDFELNFTGRNGIDRFMNSGMVANIINARTVPYSTYGDRILRASRSGSGVLLCRPRSQQPCHNMSIWMNCLRMEFSSRAQSRSRSLLSAYREIRNFGVNWNSREFTSVDPSSFVIVPGQGIVAGQISGSWATVVQL